MSAVCKCVDGILCELQQDILNDICSVLTLSQTSWYIPIAALRKDSIRVFTRQFGGHLGSPWRKEQLSLSPGQKQQEEFYQRGETV